LKLSEQAEVDRECAVVQQHYLVTQEHMLSDQTWQWIQVVGYVCMQERAVETVVYVTEVVQKREWYVGNPLAQTDVYVLKADDQELVFVHQVQHEDVVWWQTDIVEHNTVDIVDLYVITVQVLGVHVHTAEIPVKIKWVILVVVHTGIAIQTVTVVQRIMLLFLQAIMLPMAAL
jgi:hypothetical protein